MPSHLQVGLFIAIIAIVLGITLMITARRRLQQWRLCSAEIVSVESGDPDWDMLSVQFSVAGRQISAIVPAPSEYGYSRKRGEAISIRYNPAAPDQARLASSRGKLYIIGVFLFLTGAMWLAFILVMKS
jgi:hypothetical protein